MTLRRFIRKNRKEIDRYVKKQLGGDWVDTYRFRLSDKDREDWIMNDQSLYSWAKMYVQL